MSRGTTRRGFIGVLSVYVRPTVHHAIPLQVKAWYLNMDMRPVHKLSGRLHKLLRTRRHASQSELGVPVSWSWSRSERNPTRP